MRTALSALLVIVVAMFFGCQTPNHVSLDKDAIKASTSNVSSIRNDDGSGVTMANENPVQVVDDDLHITTAGKVSYVNMDTATGQLRGLLAKDAVLKNVKYTPQPDAGNPMFEAEEITIRVSDVIAAADEQVTGAQENTKDMALSGDEARKEVAKVIGNTASDVVKTVSDGMTPDVNIGSESNAETKTDTSSDGVQTETTNDTETKTDE